MVDGGAGSRSRPSVFFSFYSYAFHCVRKNKWSCTSSKSYDCRNMFCFSDRWSWTPSQAGKILKWFGAVICATRSGDEVEPLVWAEGVCQWFYPIARAETWIRARRHGFWAMSLSHGAMFKKAKQDFNLYIASQVVSLREWNTNYHSENRTTLILKK